MRDGIAVDLHDERAGGTDPQIGIDAELGLQRSRRTGSPGLVASGSAVQDRHHAPSIISQVTARHRRIAVGPRDIETDIMIAVRRTKDHLVCARRRRSGLEPSYQQKTFAPEPGKLRLLASRDGPVTVHQDVALYGAVLAPGQRVSFELKPSRLSVQRSNWDVACRRRGPSKGFSSTLVASRCT